ncbi:ABC transporter C family member [Paramyrothecium foliicola]|nr:ABC transporter C family member [Paramyrothecium foliicola]
MANYNAYNATECRDGFFGPSIVNQGCRGGFDFTLTFEESILTTTPSAVFLLLSVPRLVYLLRASDKAKAQSTYTSKLIVSSLYVVLQVVLVALVVSSRLTNTRFSIASAVLNLVAALFIAVLAHAEHVKSIRPSFLLTAYLFITLLFDAARLRTEWLISVNVAYAAVLSVSTATKLALLALETVEKRRILITNGRVPSTEATSGPFSRGFFVWLNPLLLTGWSTALQNNQLPPIHERLSSADLAARFGAQWDKLTKTSIRPSLFRTVLSVLKWELLIIVPPRLAAVTLSICQPFLTSQAMRFLTLPEDDLTTNRGYGLIAAFAFVFILSAIVTAWYEHLTFRAGSQVRGGLIALIYRKMLKLPAAELNESSAVALMGNDVETLAEQIKALIVESWANTLQVGIATWLLADQLGVVCVAPIIVGIIAIGLSGAIGNSIFPRQTAYQEATQERINFTSEVLSSIKAVKMLGYSERFASLIEQKRANDIKVGKHFRQLSVAINAVVNSNIVFAEVVMFGAYAIAAKLGGRSTFSVTQAITALSILNVMLMPLCELLASIASCFQVFGCFKRVEDFLLKDEQVDGRLIDSTVLSKLPPDAPGKTIPGMADGLELHALESQKCTVSNLSVADASFNWGETTIVDDVNLSLPSSENGSLTIVVGPIGSGKSTLLKGILGETTSSTGLVSVANPHIAYCSQTPWVMNATLRDNIVAQSGAYDEAWFNAVVEACDLVTDLARFPSGDLTVVGDNGLKLSGGQRQRLAIARAVYSRTKIAFFDDVFSGLDKVTEHIVFERVFGKNGLLRKNNTMTILATHSVHFLPQSDHIVTLDLRGRIAEQGSFTQLRSGGGYVNSLEISEPQVQNDKIGSPAVPEEEEEPEKRQTETEAAVAELEVATDRSIFKYYLSSIGSFSIAIMIFYNIGQAFFATFRHVWLAWWGEQRGHSEDDLGYWLGLFSMFGLLDVIFLVLSVGHLFFMLGPVSGKKLHTRLLNAAMNAPMSFLSNTDTGSLVNRFSQDLRLVDMVLPRSLAIFLLDVASCIGVAGLAISAIYWFTIAIPFVVVVLAMVQRFYVRTSKQLRLLEIEHKAPLYSHFLETINGLITVRAFGWSHEYRDINNKRLDQAQKPAYLLNAIQRWLTLVLDLVVAVLTVMLVVFAVTLRGKISPSLLGVALVNMMRVGYNMKGIVVEWSTLETSLGAVTRIRDFSQNTPTELNSKEDEVPDNLWPSRGELEIRNLSVEYEATAGPILRELSLHVKHGEKLGLCGRSGSGKSSLIQAILRMADTSEGQILLDGVDIATVPRFLIRQRLSCLTQDPFLFTNTVRFNADPLGESTDEEIINALKRVELWTVIQAKTEEGKPPLDEKLDESFLSHGQRQLFCLGRALLRKSSFLILDEPTSSVDSATDAKMQDIIRSEFTDRTIIMIAHRLDTILDFDTIAVLDRGILVDCGRPQDLLVDKDGAFSRLYEADRSNSAKKPSSEVDN